MILTYIIWFLAGFLYVPIVILLSYDFNFMIIEFLLYGFFFIYMIIFVVLVVAYLLTIYAAFISYIESNFLLKFEIYRWYKIGYMAYIQYILKYGIIVTLLFAIGVLYFLSYNTQPLSIRIEFPGIIVSLGYTNVFNQFISDLFHLKNENATPGILNLTMVLCLLSIFGFYFFKKLSLCINLFFINVIVRVYNTFKDPENYTSVLDYGFLKIVRNLKVEDKLDIFNKFVDMLTELNMSIPKDFIFSNVFVYIHHLNNPTEIISALTRVLEHMAWNPQIPAYMQLFYFAIGMLTSISFAIVVGNAAQPSDKQEAAAIYVKVFIGNSILNMFNDLLLYRSQMKQEEKVNFLKLMSKVDAYLVQGPRTAELNKTNIILKFKKLPFLEEYNKDILDPVPQGINKIRIVTYNSVIYYTVYVDKDGVIYTREIKEYPHNIQILPIDNIDI